MATLFRFVARFARVRIEDSSFNRFALNGIQRDFFGEIFSGGIFVGGILSDYLSVACYHVKVSCKYHTEISCCDDVGGM